MGQYFHVFANGDDAKGFITSELDFRVAFNRFAICAYRHPKVKVLAFSIEDSHPHGLLCGSYEDCLEFKQSYELLTRRYIIASRGSLDDVVFELEITEIDTEDYLKKAAAYVLVQPTKDGKHILPHDYRWSTASMYFRPEGQPAIWQFDNSWNLLNPKPFGSLTYLQKVDLLHSKAVIPDSWMVCNGFVLPTNYLDVKEFESIFKSHNCYRVFMAAGRKQLQEVTENMAGQRGINLNDIEARRIAGQFSQQLFGKKDARWLLPAQRLTLAMELRSKLQISIRQISTICRIPESELRKYLR